MFEGLLAVLEGFASGAGLTSTGAAYDLARVLTAGQRRSRTEDAAVALLARTRLDETAALLRHACYRALLDAPRGETLIVEVDLAEDPERPADREGWRERAAALSQSEGEPDLEEERSMIRRALVEAAERPPNPVLLASAALRLADESTARLYLAQALLQEGAVEQSLETAKAVIPRAALPMTVCYAHAACGIAYARAERLGEALIHYRLAARAAPESLGPAFGWLTVALRLGAAGEVAEAASRLSEVCTRESDLDEYVRVLQAGRRSGRWGTWLQVADATSLVRIELPAMAWRIRDAVLSS